MPTDENLQSRNCTLVSMCSLCNKNNENTIHLFLDCPFANAIWNWFNNLFSCRLDTSSFNNLLLVCNANWSAQTRDVITATIVHSINAIWWCRNQARFESRLCTVNHAISRIKGAYALSGNTTNSVASPTVKELGILKALKITMNYSKAPKIIEVSWQKPTNDIININCDGAARGCPGSAGGGAIFRNYKGEVLACFSDFYEIQDALYAELNKAIEAIQFAYKKGWMKVWLEVDSSTVVDILKGKIHPPWKLIKKWILCQGNLQFMDRYTSHIYREENSSADKLANYGINSKSYSVWDKSPSFIQSDCFRNSIGLPSYRFTAF
ncbi:unnamed protein product [Lupinus luteus]|uniref:RNase H type-1 domain-containing protein n=1 Tax=Lupinus luteus TaxID=3873 RepID=A0AAV1XNQ6_LUPLU